MSYTELMRYAHAVDGDLLLEQDGQRVQFICRWPADLSEDEWIVFSNQFDLAAYEKGVRALNEHGQGLVPGIHHGSLELRLMPSGRVEIDVSDARAQAPTRLIMDLDLEPDAFGLPRDTVAGR